MVRSDEDPVSILEKALIVIYHNESEDNIGLRLNCTKEFIDIAIVMLTEVKARLSTTIDPTMH